MLLCSLSGAWSRKYKKKQANTSDWPIAEADASVPQEHDTTLWHPDLDL